MNNRVPNNKSYHSGEFKPTFKSKVIKLNGNDSVIYRSSWEKRIMIWLDNNEKIKMWGSECLEIPYQMTHFDNGMTKIKTHRYYPDFYYEMLMDDGTIRKVVVEVKPQKEYNMVKLLEEGKLEIPDKLGKLKSFEYDLKMAYKNKEKWSMVIKWCDKKGYEFIIITEEHLKKFGI